jgi:xanthine dehydrogenase YagR molybdenum-binding subunit
MPDPNYQYPPMEERRVIGKTPTRLDGPQKSTGKAKYSSDYWSKDLIFGVLMGSPVAHGRIKSIDSSAAKATPGVTAVYEIAKVGDEIQWAGAELVAVAAEREEIARDAVRKVKIDWELMDHLVNEGDLKAAGKRAKAAGEKVTGDPDQAFQGSGIVVSEGHYAIPVITHCCLEPHGQAIQWDGNSMNYWPSTQNVSGIGTDIGNLLKFPPDKINVDMQYIGGGFGSKFSADRWGMVCANLSKDSGGKPVKLFLDRNVELMIAGNRPSGFANIKVAAKPDGSLVAWQSQSWATGGVGGGGMPPIPYVFTDIPNQRLNHSAVAVNAGPSRAWRAPNHPQAAYLTYSALEDLAAKLKMDPVEMHKKNLGLTGRADTYAFQLDKASELMDWKKKWHQRGDSGPGPVVKGVGVALMTWGGAGHNSKCQTTIFPNGNVVVELGSQDLGTGTRTIITQVAAETLGLPMERITLKIGSNKYPVSGGSGGSTTVGGVSASTRKSTVNALAKLCEAVAPSLNVPPDQLVAVDQRIQVKGNPSKSMTWQQACSKLGVNNIAEMGEHDSRKPDGLTTGQVGGVQMAEVSVDLDTGVVKMVKFVAVHDVGLVINPRLAESQVNGAIIMGICGALMEERVMDSQTGRMLNADMEFYKLAGIGDIGEIVAHMDIRPENDKRGVIGLGEPCAVGVIAAIGNAVANAIGVRVPQVPATPRRVLAALERRNA